MTSELRYKPGEKVIRMDGSDVAIIDTLNCVCFDGTQSYYVINSKEEHTSWNESYFRRLTKLELALQ